MLGFTTIDGGGVEGLELAYDKLLRGSGVGVAGIRDSYGRQLLVEGAVDSRAAAGEDLVLSLDKYLTFVTERALINAVQKNNAKAGVAVMIDPSNGEILAMASVPTYDPNNPRDAGARQARNRAITDEFEPGSTSEDLHLRGGLQRWQAAPRGALRLPDGQDGHRQARRPRRPPQGNHQRRGGVQALEQHRVNQNRPARSARKALYDTLVGFGFGRSTAFGLYGERRGTLRPVSRWGDIEFATHAFGHGLTATPLQLVTAFAAVAAGGVYHPPGWCCAPSTPMATPSWSPCRPAPAPSSG